MYFLLGLIKNKILLLTMQSEITELSLLIEDCSYDSKDKETLINIIKSILSYPKK